MDTRSLLDRHPVFAQLPVTARDLLASQALVSRLDTGDALADIDTPCLLVHGTLQTAHGPLSPGDLIAPSRGPACYALTACTVLRWPASLHAVLQDITRAESETTRHAPAILPWRDLRSLVFAAVLQALYAGLDVAPWVVLEPLVDHCLLYRDASVWPVLCALLGIIAVFGVSASIIHATLVTPLAVAWATALRRRSISVIYHSVAAPHLGPSIERWWTRLRTTLRAVDQLQQHGALWVHEACQAAVCVLVLFVLAGKITALGLVALLPLALWRLVSGRFPVNAAHELFGIQLVRTLHTLLVLALCVQAVRGNTMAMGRLFAVVGLWLNAWDSSMHLLPLRSLPPAVRRRMPGRAGATACAPRLHVTLSNVTVTYAGAYTPALRDVSLDLAPGSALGIIGRSGAGKSTVARLIYGSIVPDAGIVTLQGISEQAISPIARREQLAWLDAAAYLPHDDALDNLTLSANTVQLDRLAWACALCEVAPQAQATTDHTRARLALARAMMHRPRLLILDDFLDNFSVQEAHRILTRLRDATPDMTLLVMSQTPRVMAPLPNVIALDAGCIVARGAPATLLEAPGFVSYLDAEYAA